MTEDRRILLNRFRLNDVVAKVAGVRWTSRNWLAARGLVERNFLDRDSELSLDLGAFVSALEYASSRKALVLGKPSRLFFALAVDSLGCAAPDVAMIGDDVEADVGGAMAAGLMGVLVQTGKYRSGQEKQLDPPPTFVAQNLTDAIDFLLS